MRSWMRAFLCVLCCVCALGGNAQTKVWTTGTAITAGVWDVSSLSTAAPIGCDLYVGLTGKDSDYWYWMYPNPTPPPAFFIIPGSTVYASLTGSCNNGFTYAYSSSIAANGDVQTYYKRNSSTPLYINATFTVTLDDVIGPDQTSGADDSPINVTSSTAFVRYWYGPGDIVGPSNWCAGGNPSFCAPGLPSEVANEAAQKLYWYYELNSDPTHTKHYQGGGATAASNGVSTVSFPDLKDGEYTIYVRAEERDGNGNIVKASPWDLAKTFTVRITTPAKRESVCSVGSSCGSCSDGGDCAPQPTLERGIVTWASVLACTAGPHYSFFALNTDAGPGGCSQTPTIEIERYQTCSNAWVEHYHLYDACGNPTCASAAQSFSINGATITRTGTQYPNYSFDWTEADGTIYKLGLTTSSNDKAVYSVLTEQINTDQSKTVFTQVGSTLTYFDTKPGASTDVVSHRYTRNANNQLVQYQKRVGSVVVKQSDYTYTGTNLTGVTVHEYFGANSEVTSQYTLTYDGYGELASVTKSGKSVKYGRTKNNGVVTELVVTEEDTANTQFTRVRYTYNAFTTVVTREDPQNQLANQSTTYHYITDSAGRKRYVYKIVDPQGSVTVNKIYVPEGFWTENGRIGSGANTDYYQQTTNAALWGSALSTTVLYGTANARTTTYGYDTSGNTTTVTYPQVNRGSGTPVTDTGYTPTQTFTYTNGRLTARTDMDGSSTNLTYETTAPYRLLSQVRSKDGETVTTTYTYSTAFGSNGGPVATKTVTTSNPSSTWVTEYSYYTDTARKGLVQTETFKNGAGQVQWQKTYDYLVNGVTQPGPVSITTVYKQNGVDWRTTNEYRTYDAYGRLASVTDADGKTITYDITIANGLKTERTVYATGVYSERVSDCCHVISQRDTGGKVTYYLYDAINRKVGEYTNEPGQDEDTPLVSTEFDGFGRVKSVTTRRSQTQPRTMTYTYDALNRITAIDNPGTLADELYYYDPYGNLMAKAWGTGRTTLYKYDALGRLVDTWYLASRPDPMQYPGGASDVHTIYDYGTNRILARNESAGQYVYTYNALGQLTSLKWPHVNATVGYDYDTLGRKIAVSYAGTNVATYAYDPMGQLSTVTSNGESIAGYTTNVMGDRTRVDFGNGAWQTFQYNNDARHLLMGIDYAYKCTAGDTVSNRGGIRLTRNDGGSPLSWADTNDKFIKLFAYDTQNRLTEADIPGAGRTQYGWDWVANRTTPTAVYNDADQLTGFGGSGYTYTPTGDLTAITGAGARSFTYTNAGLLNTVTTGAATASMSWDSLGNRLSYTSSTGGTTQYVYDITAGVPAVIAEITGGSPVLYVREPNGALIARKAGTDRKYYHFDELGSTLFLTDAGAVQTDKYVYNAFGGVITRTGSTNQPYQYIGRYGYYTHWQDANMPLLQLGVRFYNPAAGVFTQRDPVLDGKNWYSHVSGRVMTAVDPSGRAAIIAIGEEGVFWHSHYALRFDIPCKPKCVKSVFEVDADAITGAGLYPPNGGTVMDDSERVQPPVSRIVRTPNGLVIDHGRPEWIVAVKQRYDPEFDIALCACVNAYASSVGWARWPRYWYGQACGTWAKSMWQCAESRIGKSLY